MSYRIDRINEQVREIMTEILRTVKDPRVGKAFVTITSADVSKDLSIGKIYFGVIGADPEEVSAGLKSASGYIRSELAERLNLRITPKLIFIKDDSTERAMHIAGILKEISEEPKKDNKD